MTIAPDHRLVHRNALDEALQVHDMAARLVAMARASDRFMAALRAVREQGLVSWCIGAGAVRTLVWDHLCGLEQPSEWPDCDVAYFEPCAPGQERDPRIQASLAAAMPDVAWDVTNQAAVHRWHEAYFGHPAAPYRSLEEAVASWPEFATCVGLTLAADDSIGVIAPHGLDDLFARRVRYNPARATAAAYRERVAKKRYARRWPGVTVIPC